MGSSADIPVCVRNATIEVPLRGVSGVPQRHDSRIFLKRGKPYLRALDDINLEVRRGERVGILGSNGSGKTTLLRLVSGMIPIDRGSVQVRGSVRSLVAIGAGTLPALSGRQNARLRYSLLELQQTSLAAYVADVANFSELGDFFDLPVGTYSPGMLSRLQFAMSTVEPADILVLDEWLGVADRSFHDKATQRLTSLVDRSGVLLLASHDEALLSQMTHRRIVLERGHIAFDSAGASTNSSAGY
jgi:ABC-type polysaccharide/polyol phosphate transport system ATPase subunit